MTISRRDDPEGTEGDSGPVRKLSPVGEGFRRARERVAAAEFLLEGMVAHKLSRSEERGFSAQEKTQRKQERAEERDYDD